MASDYERADPVQSYAERRGITFRERAAEIVRRVVPERVRNVFDGLRPSPEAVPGTGSARRPEREAPERKVVEDPEAALRQARTKALVRHARAVDAIFDMQERGGKASPEQVKELQEARKVFEELRPYGSHDAEAAYREIRNLSARRLAARSTAHPRSPARNRNPYQSKPARRPFRGALAEARPHQPASVSGGRHRRLQGDALGHGDMAKSLERDPQLESILANRKRALGIAFESGRRLGLELAFSHGIDLGRGRGIGI